MEEPGFKISGKGVSKRLLREHFWIVLTGFHDLGVIAFMTNYSAKYQSDAERGITLFVLKGVWNLPVRSVTAMLPKMERNWSNAWICLCFHCLQGGSLLV